MRTLTRSKIGMPRHRALLEIRRLINEGKEFPDGLLPSEQILSERLGISKPTTHRALSQLADEGLLRCEGRQWLITSSTKTESYSKPTIIFADDWHDINHPSCACLIQGLMSGGIRHGLRVQVELLKRGESFNDENPSLWNEIARRKADGLVVSWISEKTRHEIFKINPKLAIVFTHSPLSGPMAASVVYDWWSAGFQATQHLLENGSRKILVMNLSHNDFIAGCEDALAAKPGVSANSRHEIVGMNDDMEALALRIAADDSDAMAFSDDRMACKVLKACGKIIPNFWEKMKVVSTDNLQWVSVLPSQVTRIWFDPKMLGETVMTSMAALLEDRPGANSVVRVKPKLVQWASQEMQPIDSQLRNF